MKQNEQNNQHEEFELLRAGFSDQANLLAQDELSELFGGYTSCSNGFCESGYKGDGIGCKKNWCPAEYRND